MAERYRQGRSTADAGQRHASRTTVDGARATYATAMDALALDAACQSAFRLVDATNEYIAASEPWALAKRGGDAELDAGAVDRGRSAARRGRAAEPGHAGIGRGDSERLGAPVRRTPDLRLDRPMPCCRSSGDRHVTQGNALWPRLESRERAR